VDFVALDVETANPNLSSICQIAVVDFNGGVVTGSWQSLVDPQDYFDPRNTGIHGISEAAVRGAPTIPALVSELQARLAGALVASHTRLTVSRFFGGSRSIACHSSRAGGSTRLASSGARGLNLRVAGTGSPMWLTISASNFNIT
jgi:DNA polymerase-3 subunit epsilon